MLKDKAKMCSTIYHSTDQDWNFNQSAQVEN